MRKSSTLELIALAIFILALCATVPARATCPAGSQFFAYGGAGGCVKPGSNEVVVKCFRNPSPCATGWSTEYAGDEKWCCPPAAGGGVYMPPSGPREDCFGRCRRDVTRCKNYAQQTSTNDQMLRDWLNSCDITNRQCRATCEPLKNNPQ